MEARVFSVLKPIKAITIVILNNEKSKIFFFMAIGN